MAGGWAAIILRLRGHPRWLLLGAASALIGVLLVAGSLLSLIVFGSRGREAGSTASVFFGFLLYGWLIGSCVAAAMIRAPDPPRRHVPVWSIVAFLLVPVTLIAGCQGSAAVVPA